MNRLHRAPAILVLLFAASVGSSFVKAADDGKAAPPDKQAANDPPARPDTDTPKPDAPKPDLKKDLKALTDDLLDLVIGPNRNEKKKPAGGKQPEAGGAKSDGAKTDADPLESAIEGMRKAQNRIAGKDTGEGTRDVQDAVLRDLEKLLEQAKQPPKSPPSPSSSDSPQQSRSSRNAGGSKSDQSKSQSGTEIASKSAADKPESEPSSKDKSETEKPETEKPETEKSEAEKARESSDEARARREREAEMARRRDFIKDVWGHLPPKLREKLLNVSGDKALPKYDDLVRRYFESLADDERTPATKGATRKGTSPTP